MKKVIHSNILLLFFLLGFISTVNAQQKFSNVKQNINERINEGYLQTVSVAYIYPNGQTQYLNFGYLSADSLQKATKNTIYEIGSISKTFTSLILARMVEEGRVSLDTPIGTILPDSVSPPIYEGKKITLLHLATHTSGLPRVPLNMLSFAEPLNPYANYTVQQMYTFLNSYELERPPGGKLAYSNLGAGLLGHLLTVEADMPYYKLIEKYITNPLHMEDTSVEVPEMKLKRFAEPYNYGEETARWNFKTLSGAGAIRSTAADLATYLKAQMGFHNITFDSAIANTHKIHYVSPNDSTTAIGLGWFISTRYDTIFWHSGGTGGYRTFVGWNTDDSTASVILASGTQGVNDLGLRMLDERFKLRESQDSVKNEKTIEIKKEILKSYTGTYQVSPFFSINIFITNDYLMAQATAQPAIRIYPESETRFVYKVVDAEIEFHVDSAGSVTALTLYQNGREIVGTKVK